VSAPISSAFGSWRETAGQQGPHLPAFCKKMFAASCARIHFSFHLVVGSHEKNDNSAEVQGHKIMAPDVLTLAAGIRIGGIRNSF
jgi:hypothetical protein